MSYSEVNRYKQSVLINHKIDEPKVNNYPEVFTQFVADNIDHNIQTLNGYGSFHGIGMIAVSTPFPGYCVSQTDSVSRGKVVGSNALTMNKGIPIKSYIGPLKPALCTLKMLPYKDLLSSVGPTEGFDLFWKSTLLFNSRTNLIPSWSGYMQMNYTGTYPGVSTITFLPIIDLPPGYERCIYSTLLFIHQQSSYLNIETPCITFDQPLWLKAVEIINAKSMNIVCRLGDFHLLMSFLGSIGKLMEGSGLTELLETIYGSNTVKHIMTGKAYARALRATFSNTICT